MNSNLNQILSACASIVLSISFANGQNLPSLGDRISGTVSLDQEYEMGQQFLAQIRRSTRTIPDAVLINYLENVTYKLASRSQLQDHRLSFVIIDSEELNAFAAPGGIIGVNTGLFLNARSESEFASVMAHEIAHVSQRHFARQVDQAQSAQVGQLASLLASVLVMATSDAQHGAAAVTAIQGRAIENQLRFSRSNEAEADRVGQDNMFAAGFDPKAMGTLFENLQSISRFRSRPPEFLLSHPVTESRIADARGRAVRYPQREYGSNMEYQINRTRVIGHYSQDKSSLILEYQRRLEESLSDLSRDVNQYGLVIAFYENELYADAARALLTLLEKDPNRISYVVTMAEILNEQNEPRQAMTFLARHMEINPNNHALTMEYVNSLIAARNYIEAAEMLEAHSAYRKNDHHLWFQLAETWGQAGNISKVHQARASYFELLYDFRSAREQLQFALRIESDNGSAPSEQARLRQKITDLEQRMLALSEQ